MHTLAITDVVEQLLDLPHGGARRAFLEEHACSFSEADLQRLKSTADQLLRADLDRYLNIGELLQWLGELAENEAARALSLLIRANAYSVGGLGQYAEAVDLYDQAASIYAALNRPLDEARSQVGRVFALTNLGRHAEAEVTAEWATTVLEAHGEWLPLAKMVSNVGISFGNQGDYVQALAMFDRAREYTLKLDGEPIPFLPSVEHNRSIALRELGRYEESMVTSQRARELHMAMGNSVEAARSLQSLATTYFVLGMYNEALAYLDEVRHEFARDGRTRDAMRAELYIVECLVQLRRFGAVLEKCAQIRALFEASGARYEVAQSDLYAAMAYSGLGRYTEAWDALELADTLFQNQGNDAGRAAIRLRQSHLLYMQEQYQQSADLAAGCADLFVALDRPVDAAFARVANARSLLALDKTGVALGLLEQACAIGEEKRLPDLCQQCHHLLGVVAGRDGNDEEALREFDRAIEALELLRGRLMVEFRAGFVEDKELVYGDAVELCVGNGQFEKALTYVEQAKSRALIELIAQKLDLGLRARSPADRPLLDELVWLRNERERLVRRWEGSDDSRDALLSAGDAGFLDAQAGALDAESRIMELWHTLLIRNADYAQDAALWRVRAESFQELLPDDGCLLEYYSVHDRLFLFEVTRDAVQVHMLGEVLEELTRLLELIQLNLDAAPTVRSPKQCAELTSRTHRILHRLFDRLLAPLAARLPRYRRLIIVPHGALHYLPFQALSDGEHYLLETHEISYLPSGSFLRYCTQTGARRGPLLAVGHSYGGLLPNAPEEAIAVAELMNGAALTGRNATKEQFERAAGNAGILHIATHGEFRADNPLFSGLYLDDGWLATLDIFDLELSAALVTLSACQTGRNVIGGGDELLGLMRAFLSAGVVSLALTHWRVEDASTASLMHEFYTHLARGDSKSAALRRAQLSLLEQGRRASEAGNESCTYVHPYYWAPFFLVGNAEPLPPVRSEFA